jgi:hypothetical protein
VKKSQELELQVKELQKEIERLKRQEEGIPIRFDRECALRYLESRKDVDLGGAFDWEDTAQGQGYWGEIYDGGILSETDIIQIQGWIIRSYVQEFGH